MCPINPVDTYSNAKLEALLGLKEPITDALSFMPNLTVVKGQILGQVSAANANEVQTINYTGAWAAGDTLTLSIAGIDGGTFSTTLTMDATPAFTAANVKAAIEAMLDAAGYEGATVTVVNAGATDQTVTFGGTAANWDMPLMTATYVTAGDGTVTVDATTGGNRIGLWGPYVGTLLANPALPTVAWKGSGGYFPVDSTHIVCITHLTAQGESLPSPGVIMVKSAATDSLDVTPAALPSGCTGINIYVDGMLAATSAQTTATLVNVPGVVTTLALGTLAAKAPPRVSTAFTNTDGRHVARAIAQYSFRTDYLGRVVYAGANQSPQWGAYETTSPAYFAGAFKTSELTGLDANAVNDLGKLIKGSVSDGVLVI